MDSALPTAWARHYFYNTDRIVGTIPTLVTGNVNASLDTALYHDYLCLVTSKKQQIK